MEMIQINQLQKYYGKFQAVEDVTFSVKAGEIFGFVGPNGAGKSTTIRMLLNFIFPTAGTATITGKDVVTESEAIKQLVGYVPSDVRFYENMTVLELLKVSNGFYQQSDSKEVERLCDLFDIDKKKRFRQLSTGNKKKVAIVIALAIQPKVLILDEPTNGLDPIIQKRLFHELREQAERGTAVLLSSHNLADVEEYCDRVGFIKEGKIVAIQSLKEIQTVSKIVTTIGGTEIHHELMERIAMNGEKRVYRYGGDAVTLLALLQQTNSSDFTIENESLEDKFLHLYRKDDEL